VTSPQDFDKIKKIELEWRILAASLNVYAVGFSEVEKLLRSG